MRKAPPIFDVQLSPSGLKDEELQALRGFGLEEALLTPGLDIEKKDHEALLERLRHLVRFEIPRLEKAGIRGKAAVGIHPLCLPRRGLQEVLDALPGFFDKGRALAIGAIGLHHGGPLEEQAFLSQLALARRLSLPVLVHTPARHKVAITQRTLTLLARSRIPAHRILVNQATEKTVRLIHACGHVAGLTIHPDALSAERAQALIQKQGGERLVLSSASGKSAGDLLGLPRLLSRLETDGASEALVENVAYRNASRFFKR